MNEYVDFSNQFFLTIAEELHPDDSDQLFNNTFFTKQGRITGKNQLHYLIDPQTDLLKILVPKQQPKATLIINFVSDESNETLPVLFVKTGKLQGVHPHKVIHLGVSWKRKDGGFSTDNDIPFQIFQNSMSYIYLGRKDHSLSGELLIAFSFPNTSDTNIVYEFEEIKLLAIDKKFRSSFYPPDINYSGIRPSLAKSMFISNPAQETGLKN